MTTDRQQPQRPKGRLALLSKVGLFWIGAWTSIIGDCIQPVQGQDDTVVELVHGQAVVLSAAMDERIRLTYNVHNDATLVHCAMSGGNDNDGGDADLYVRWEKPVDFGNAAKNHVSIACATERRGTLVKSCRVPHQTAPCSFVYEKTTTLCSAPPWNVAVKKYVPIWALPTATRCTWGSLAIVDLTA